MSKFKEGDVIVSIGGSVRKILKVEKNLYTVCDPRDNEKALWKADMKTYNVMFRKLTKLERALA